MNPVLQAALDFLDAGVCVVPASMDGSKSPIGTWKKYQVEKPSKQQVEDWFSGNQTGIGIITGNVSGNLEMVELEGRAVQGGLLDEARELALNSGLGEIWEIISNGYVEVTPSGGIHILYRIADEPVPGNTKLARRPGENGSVEVLCETRGEGGFVVTAPSSGAVHPSGQPWVLIKGSPSLIPMLSMDERNAIHSVFKALDSMPAKESIVTSLASTNEKSTEKPGDDFNARATWKEILEPKGWKVVYTSGGVTYWRRPGKNEGISATTGRNDGDNLFVFTTSTSFEAEKPYSKFAAFAHLEHQGDFSSAAKALRQMGYGSNSLPSLSLPSNPKPSLSAVPNLDADHIEAPRERSSWYPKELDVNNVEDEPAPAFLARNDGHRLFYKAKINALFGESESGKTWVALYSVVQSLQVGERVMYIDFEDSARGILNRLKAFGLEERHFSNFRYANPDQNLLLDERADLIEALVEFKPELVVIDGVNAAMTLLNLDLTSNRDATFFSQQLLKPIANSGACVITIDHVTKSKDNRGNYAIGAQAKRADINGAAILVDVVYPFGRGMTGELNLKVTKDRPGHVRAVSKEAKFAGRAILKSSVDGSVSMSIEAPHLGEGTKFRPTSLMEKISMLLESAMVPLSKNAVAKDVTGKREWVLQACQILIEEKFVAVENGARNSLNLRSLRPYRVADDQNAGVEPFDYEGEIESA